MGHLTSYNVNKDFLHTNMINKIKLTNTILVMTCKKGRSDVHKQVKFIYAMYKLRSRQSSRGLGPVNGRACVK